VREAVGWGLGRNTDTDQKFFDDSLALKLSISVRFESHSNVVSRKGLNRPPPLEARKYRNSHLSYTVHSNKCSFVHTC